MRGYLTNLLIRTFEPQPAIRPRLAPIFAPPETGPGWLSSAPESEGKTEAIDRPDRGSSASFVPSPPPAAPPPEMGAAAVADPSVALVDPTTGSVGHRKATSPIAPADPIKGSVRQDRNAGSPIAPADPIKGSVRQDRNAASPIAPADPPTGSVRQVAAPLVKGRSDRSANAGRHRVARTERPATSPHQPLRGGSAELQDDVGGKGSTLLPGLSPGTSVIVDQAGQPATQEPLSLETFATRESDHATNDHATNDLAGPGRNRLPSTSAGEPSTALSIVRNDLARLYSQAPQRDPGAAGAHLTTSSAPHESVPETNVSAAAGDGKPRFLTASSRHVTARDDVRASSERVPQSPPPTIEVTIGRIEVRATTNVEPRRKSPASAGALSLDEYLRRRSGGGSP
jgi:hypothetical protein